MKQELTEREALLIELIQHLAYGSQEEMGLSLDEIMRFLTARVVNRDRLTVLEILESSQGRSFVNDVLRKK